MSEQHTMVQSFDEETRTNTFLCKECGRKIAVGTHGMVVLRRGRGRFAHSGGFSSPGATLTVSARVIKEPHKAPDLTNWSVAEPKDEPGKT
jgi:hypothetical protein